MLLRTALLSLILALSTSVLLFGQENDPMLDWYNGYFSTAEPGVNPDVLIKEGESRLAEAVEAHDAKAESFERKNLAMLHITKSFNYDDAMDHLIRVLAIEDSLSLHTERVFTYIAMAETFRRVSDFHKSAGFLDQAAELNRKYGSVTVLVKILNDLGKVHASEGLIDAAFENYNLVLEYEADLDNPRVRAEALFNIAHLYKIQNKHELALKYHKEALQLYRGIQDKLKEAQSLNDIALLYTAMKNPEKALANHKVALELRLKSSDKAAIGQSYVNVGILYYQEGNAERALANLELGLEASREAQAQHLIAQCFEYISYCHRDLGDFKKALEYKESQLAILEFIQGEKNQQQLADKQNQYELSKKEDQISKLESIRLLRESELREQMRFRNFLIAITILTAVVFVLILFLYLLKRKSNKALRIANAKVREQNLQLQDLNATKDKFFSIISHDLKGPLNSLTSFSSLLINHTENLTKDEIKMLATDLDKSLKNLFALLENLLEWSRSQTGNIEFKADTFDVVELLNINKDLLKAQAGNKDINIMIENSSPLRVSAHKHSINTVIRNLVSNAIKFTPNGGTIKLSAEAQDQLARVKISDTGVGMSQEVMEKLFRIDTKHSTKGTADEKGTGLGLILCKDFVEKNGGTIQVDSVIGKGSTFSFTIPVPVTEYSNTVVA